MSTALAIERTPELIASEINHLKQQTRNIVLYNAIEIGRRLCEAKQFIPHGEWGKWLETSVDYSQSTANNLMKIFTEYGANQMALFGETGPKSQALENLSYTQAVILLGLPGEEREEFIENNDVENMSTRELQQAIKDLAQARNELEEKEAEAKRLQDEKDAAEAEASRLLEIQTSLNARLAGIQKQLAEAQANDNSEVAERLQESLEKTDEELMEAQKRIEELEQKLKDKPIDIPAAEVVEKIPEEVEQELTELRQQKKSEIAVKYSIQFENLVKGFQALLTTLAEIDQADPEEGDRHRHATLELLSKMSARL